MSGGASVKVAQELARHSTPVLTIGRYSHVRLHDLTGALEALPASDRNDDREAAALRATGTDDAPGTQPYAQPREHDPMRADAIGCGGDPRANESDRDGNPLPIATLRDETQTHATKDRKVNGCIATGP